MFTKLILLILRYKRIIEVTIKGLLRCNIFRSELIAVTLRRPAFYLAMISLHGQTLPNIIVDTGLSKVTLLTTVIIRIHLSDNLTHRSFHLSMTMIINNYELSLLNTKFVTVCPFVCIGRTMLVIAEV